MNNQEQSNETIKRIESSLRKVAAVHGKDVALRLLENSLARLLATSDSPSTAFAEALYGIRTSLRQSAS